MGVLAERVRQRQRAKDFGAKKACCSQLGGSLYELAAPLLALEQLSLCNFLPTQMPSLYNRYSLQIKLRILEAARSDGDWELIAEMNNVNISTARSWLRCYPKTSDVLQPRPRGGKRQHKMTADGVAYLLSELLIGPVLSLRQLADTRHALIHLCLSTDHQKSSGWQSDNHEAIPYTASIDGRIRDRHEDDISRVRSPTWRYTPRPCPLNSSRANPAPRARRHSLRHRQRRG
ncbi:Homeodomain-like [Phytophthora cactorum]|nr:Homeodomain-like [Phytophthora cactorum]